MKSKIDQIEKRWLKKLAKGDEQAFQCVYEKHWESLFLAAYQRLGSQPIAEELIQDLFLDLWVKRSTLHIRTSLAAYLHGALKYRILDHMRHEIVREKYIQHLTHFYLSGKNEVIEEMYSKDLQYQLQSAESMLPPRCYTIYQLSRKYHFSNREIAEQLNISPKTVENQITKALRTLRVYLSKVSTFLLMLCVFWH